jgi:hypothetical protein
MCYNAQMKIHKLALAALLIFMMTTAVSASPPTTQSNSGWLSAYDIEPTIGTFNVKLYDGVIELGHDVYLATPGCDRIGEVGIITIGDSPPLTYQVFDCAGDAETIEWMTANNIIAEIDWYSWQRYGLGRATMTAVVE